MSAALIKIDGLEEEIAALRKFSDQLPPRLKLGMYEAFLPVKNAIQTYPPQPPPRNPNREYIRGVGSQYVPTGRTRYTSEKYGQSTTMYFSGDTSLTIESPASYASFIRGDLDGYTGAWMHQGVWDSLQSIVDQAMPDIEEKLESAVNDLIEESDL